MTTEEDVLRALIRTVGSSLEVHCDTLSFSYGSIGATWFWTIRVERHRFGRKYRGPFSAFGDTPAKAVDDLFRKIAIPGWLDACYHARGGTPGERCAK